MSEKRFTIVGEEYVGYTQGNAYIISNGECKFSLWESKEDAQKVCDYLNEQQEKINELEIELTDCKNRKEQSDYKLHKKIRELENQFEKIPPKIREVWIE